MSVGVSVPRYVALAISTAKRLGLTADVTITRKVSATYTPASDTPSTPAPTSFTASAVSESPKPDEPLTGGLNPQRSTIWTMNAADCAFTPETGHSLTVDGLTWRVIDVQVTSIGTLAVLYAVEVAR